MDPNDPAQFFADYSKRDAEIVDYQFYRLPELPSVGFRGPPIPEADLASGNYCTAIGAAQTLGVYAAEPYPALLARETGLPCLNLSTGGGTAAFFASQLGLIERINRGRLAILQVMTARSEGNSRGEPVGINFMRDTRTGETEMTEAFWLRLLAEEREAVPALISETLVSWRQSYARLISQLRVPVILFYFSTKPEDEQVNYAANTRDEFYGSFPQFVNMPAIRDVAALCAGYAECRSARGLPHPLLSRFTGEPVKVDFGALHATMDQEIHATNAYYPSPEMHADAAAALAPVVRKLLGG
jgi:Domain of unknown function (DUF6473)